MQCIKWLFCCCSASPSSDILFEEAGELYKHYQLTKRSQVLKKAIDKYSASLAARRKEKNPDEAHILVNYATALWVRYEQTPGRSEDLQQIIDFYERAYDQWSKERSNLEGYSVLLLDLGNAYYKKSSVVAEGAEEALDKAISFLDKLDLSSDSVIPSEARIKGMVMLGAALNRRCNAHKTTTKLDEAIDYLKEALNDLEKMLSSWTTGEKQQEQDEEMLGALRILCCKTLAEAYDARFQYQAPANLRNLDLAIDYSKRAIALLPTGHPDRGTTSYNLAYQLYRKYARTREGGKENGHLAANDMNRQESVQDLKDACEAVAEAQRLLEGTGYSESVRKLSEVLKAHMDDLSRPSSRNTNRATTPIGGEKLPSRKNRSGNPNA